MGPAFKQPADNPKKTAFQKSSVLISMGLWRDRFPWAVSSPREAQGEEILPLVEILR